jgi:5-methylcytosine-specific restriction endonuclease McrA
MHLSAADALRKLDAIDLEEKSRIAEGIALIAVIDHRRDYLGAGYSSMFTYCTGRLHMSEDKAVRRIEVARLALKVPQVLEHLADGRLSVTTACVLAPHLTPETAAELLTSAAFRSRQEIARLLAERAQPAVAETLALDEPNQVEDSSSLSAPVRIDSPADSSAPPAANDTPDPVAPAQASHARRGRIFSSASGGHEVRLSLTDAELAVLRQAQSLLGHAVPSGDLALIYARAMKHYLAHLEKQRLGAKPASAKAAPRAGGRGIPRALSRFVWERDGGRCAFVSADRHRCESTHRLEIDHIQPVALGGETKPENLRLLCRVHNQYEAERVLGKEHVQNRRELEGRARARTKAATAAAASRSRARAGATPEARNVRTPARKAARKAHEAQEARAAQHPHHDDILAALLGLGFTKPEASRGGKLADTMLEASLETCVRQALTELTRPVVARGERRARCTA